MTDSKSTAMVQHHALIEAAVAVGGYRAARDILSAREEWEMTSVSFTETFDCFPWDGSLAVQYAMEQMFGFVMASHIPPPNFFSQPCGPNGETTPVLWGSIDLPGGIGRMGMSSTTESDGRVRFVLKGSHTQKFSDRIEALRVMVRERVRTKALFQNRYVRMGFYDDDDEVLPIPAVSFPTPVNPTVMRFEEPITREMEAGVFGYLRHYETLIARGAKPKRGVLLDGPPGVGKTLLMQAIAWVALKAGWTVVQVKNAEEFITALRYVQMTPPLRKCVIEVEDIDREVGGERDGAMDDILNAMDGVDTKLAQVLVVMTTNNRKAINATMLRTERLDLVLRIEAPNEETAAAILRDYAVQAGMDPSEDTRPAGKVLAGLIPATIRECVNRALFYAVQDDPQKPRLTGTALRLAAEELVDEERLRGQPGEGTPATVEFQRGDVVVLSAPNGKGAH